MFNMRDISKVIQGIYIFDKFYCDSKLTIFRLWVHESLRVFHDRLVSSADRTKLKKLISDQLESTLQSNIKECTDPE
jgi:dynein heavy chain